MEIEQEQEDIYQDKETSSQGIPINADWQATIESLKSNYGTELLLSPDKDIKLQIGKQYLYISREDVHDSKHSTNYPIPLQVARIKIDGGKLVELIADDQQLLAETFSKLSTDPLFKKIIEHFGIATEVSEKEAATIQNMIQDVKDKTDEKMALKQFLQEKAREVEPRRSIHLTKIEDNSIDVPMQNVKILKSDDKKQYILTLGAGPCIIAAAHNPETQTSGIAHMDAFTDMESMINQLKNGVGVDSIKILGGDMSSLNKVLKLKKILEKLNISVDEWDVLNTQKSIAIDNETGEFLDVIGKGK